MPHLTTVHVQSESKIKLLGQNQVYAEYLKSLTLKTMIWHNNSVSRSLGSFKDWTSVKLCMNTGFISNLFICIIIIFIFFFFRIGHDLAVMSRCNHAIASRGTFSFWVGFLAGGKIVYTYIRT